MITPRRHRGYEHLDDPSTDPALRERSLRDVRLANTLLGGSSAVLAELGGALSSLGTEVTLLDVGTGLADIPARARERAARQGIRLTAFGVDSAESLVRASSRILDAGACADVRLLPFATSSVDVVLCSQLLHHFEDDEIGGVLRELDRVARRLVIVSDLRRSWFAVGGFWLLTWVLGFHRVSRHDGAVSVLRGFTRRDLARHVLDATGVTARVRRHIGYRLTATWVPSR